MKPKLILLNGAPGVGKSTLASLYAEAHPMTLRIDTDEVRRLISHQRAHGEDSGFLSKKIVGAMAQSYLAESRDVVIAQRCGKIEYVEALEEIAQESGPSFMNFLLMCRKRKVLRSLLREVKLVVLLTASIPRVS